MAAAVEPLFSCLLSRGDERAQVPERVRRGPIRQAGRLRQAEVGHRGLALDHVTGGPAVTVDDGDCVRLGTQQAGEVVNRR